MVERIVFRVTSPLGYSVVLTRNRWREIVRFKHPAIKKLSTGSEAMRVASRSDSSQCKRPGRASSLFVVGNREAHLRCRCTGRFRRAFCGHGLLNQPHQARKRTVEKVRVYFDRTGNSLTVWFDDPQQEHVCEEIEDDVVLMKDERGRVIGFERLNYQSKEQQAENGSVPVEVQLI